MMREWMNMRDTRFLTDEEHDGIELMTNESEFSTIFTDLSTSADFLLITK